MSRRLGVIGVVVIALFAVVLAQSAYITYFRADALNKSSLNPRVIFAGQKAPRGDIVAADGEVLAHSVASGDSQYPYKRIYPLGPLTAGVVGWVSNYYGSWGLEAEYQAQLVAHKQPPESFGQVLAPTYASDTVSLTIEPAVQRVAAKYLAGRDGAVVVLDPRDGSVISMYSNPTYDPTPMTSTVDSVQKGYWAAINKKNKNGFPPLGLVATQQSFPPGSTFKVVTTSATFAYRPDLAHKSYPGATCIPLPYSNKTLCNDSGSYCGGTVYIMLPPSCDTGYALLGRDLGGTVINAQATKFGFNSRIPLDLPGTVVSYFPDASAFVNNTAQLMYSSIGQQDVRATALQNALVAAGVANNGVVMAPHLLSSIIGPLGTVVHKAGATPWKVAMTPAQAAQVVPLMRNVVRYGTASGVGFLYQDEVAAKTGTAQTGTSLSLTDDWMIAFAPASHPTVAIAVVLPFQPKTGYGATVAGPVVKCVLEAALAVQKGLPASGTSTTCP